MANNNQNTFTYFYFGRYGAYENYYAFALTKDDCKKMLFEMYKKNCEGNGYELTEEDIQTFEEEVYISEYKEFRFVNGFGFNTLDNGERVFRPNPLNPKQIITATESRCF